jgi:uncharacterized protein with NRDE domain
VPNILPSYHFDVNIDTFLKKLPAMCLIVFAYKTRPGVPLVFAGNRDEFYERPTEKAHIWSTTPEIIAGKDKKAGGTWLGLSSDGRIAAITNYRDMNQIKPDAPSRGHIVKDALTSPHTTEQYLEHLQRVADEYNGFNLITGNREKLFYFNNQTMQVEELKPGIYSLSNAFLNTPWPKSEWAKEHFRQILDSGEQKPDRFFSMLKNSDTYPPEMLPETGLSNEKEKAVSAVFIKTEGYGSRSSTVMKLFQDDSFYFEERTYKAASKKVKSRQKFTGF